MLICTYIVNIKTIFRANNKEALAARSMPPNCTQLDGVYVNNFIIP